jgi:hypothetical protein
MAVLEEQWIEIKKPLDDEYQIWLRRHENVNKIFYNKLSVSDLNLFSLSRA